MRKKSSVVPRMSLLISMASTVILVTGGCGMNIESDVETGANILSRSDSEVVVSDHTSEGTLSLRSTLQGDSSYRLALELDEKRLDVTLEPLVGGALGLTVEGYGHTFSNDEIVRLRQFGLAYQAMIQQGRDPVSIPVHERMVIAAVAYLSAFPEGYVHETYRSHRAEKGIDCIYKGDWREAVFTDFWGDTIRVWDEVGFHGGRGRCGDDWFSTGWTQDCFNHDECQIYMGDHGIFELPGGLGPNCLDEFFSAIDDFFFAILLGCTG